MMLYIILLISLFFFILLWLDSKSQNYECAVIVDKYSIKELNFEFFDEVEEKECYKFEVIDKYNVTKTIRVEKNIYNSFEIGQIFTIKK